MIVILLVLVAVGIMWVVVKSLIDTGAEEIELGRFTLDLEIKAAQIEDDGVTVVVVRRNPGEGNFIGMNFVFSDGINSEIIREDTILEELEEKSFNFILTEISTENLETISVAPIFELSSGEESIGNVADSFEVTEEMKAGITGGVVSNFEALGFEGMGVVNYSISSGEVILPEFKRAIVNPLDVYPGDNQTFTAHVYSPYNIIEVTTTTQLDNSILNLDLEKIDEYEESSGTIEIWSVNWTVYDTHVNVYRTTIIARDAEENENNITLTWTDPCSGITHGQDSTIDGNCVVGVNQIAGLDNGILTIQSGITVTLNSGSKLIFNEGKSLIPDGSISMDGGSITKGDLYYYDGDSDNYAANTTLLLGSGDIRASSGSLLGTDDCCDTDANAKPGQTSWFTTTNGCGIYDYNCNGQVDLWMPDGGGSRYSCVGDECGDMGLWSGTVPACGDSKLSLLDMCFAGKCAVTTTKQMCH